MSCPEGCGHDHDEVPEGLSPAAQALSALLGAAGKKPERKFEAMGTISPEDIAKWEDFATRAKVMSEDYTDLLRRRDRLQAEQEIWWDDLRTKTPGCMKRAALRVDSGILMASVEEAEYPSIDNVREFPE